MEISEGDERGRGLFPVGRDVMSKGGRSDGHRFPLMEVTSAKTIFFPF